MRPTTSAHAMRTGFAALACTALVLTGAASSAGAVTTGTVAKSTVTKSAVSAPFSPEVVHTGQGPTGYTVTFRYYAPTATSVRLRGEWFFSDAAHTTTTSSAGRLPSQWQPGDFPIASPNSGAAANWPVVQMTLDAATG